MIGLLLTSGHVDLPREDIPDNGRFLPKLYRWHDLMLQVEGAPASHH